MHTVGMQHGRHATSMYNSSMRGKHLIKLITASKQGLEKQISTSGIVIEQQHRGSILRWRRPPPPAPPPQVLTTNPRRRPPRRRRPPKPHPPPFPRRPHRSTHQTDGESTPLGRRRQPFKRDLRPGSLLSRRPPPPLSTTRTSRHAFTCSTSAPSSWIYQGVARAPSLSRPPSGATTRPDRAHPRPPPPT